MYRFSQPLQEGVIVNRRNRFIMDVVLGDTVVACHCPVTGRIGDLTFDGVPCLVSASEDPRRRTAFTVEAISIDTDRQWIGIHQGRVNDYIEHLLMESSLQPFQSPTRIEREVSCGDARIDFVVDDVLMEVKMPLTELFVTPLPHFAGKKTTRPVETRRLVRHLNTLIHSLEQHQRAVLLYVFLYDAPVFTGNPNRKDDGLIRQSMRQAIADGLEVWQVNGHVSPEGITLLRCFETTASQ